MAAEDAPRVARAFHRLGWMGFWIQAALALLPLGMIAYFLLGKATGSGLTLGVMEYLAIFGLAILAFTALWSYRYTRLAKRIADPERRPAWSSVAKTLWIGLWASCLGIVVSLALLLIEVVRLLVLFMKAPQAGVPVMRTEIETRAEWVSALDALSLLAELCTLIGELVILGFTLWLLFAVTRKYGAFSDEEAAAE